MPLKFWSESPLLILVCFVLFIFRKIWSWNPTETSWVRAYFSRCYCTAWGQHLFIYHSWAGTWRSTVCLNSIWWGMHLLTNIYRWCVWLHVSQNKSVTNTQKAVLVDNQWTHLGRNLAHFGMLQTIYSPALLHYLTSHPINQQSFVKDTPLYLPSALSTVDQSNDIICNITEMEVMLHEAQCCTSVRVCPQEHPITTHHPLSKLSWANITSLAEQANWLATPPN